MHVTSWKGKTNLMWLLKKGLIPEQWGSITVSLREAEQQAPGCVSVRASSSRLLPVLTR